MLTHLQVKKYALIDKCDIKFYPGFSVITGETGAGKSILLGALNLLLGERADVRAIKTGIDKCSVEAVFDVTRNDVSKFFRNNEFDFDGRECILRREVSINGKSRAFINDTPASLSQMKELGRKLIDIHSQHQNLLLGGFDFQIGVIDGVAHNGALLSTYKEQYAEYAACSAELVALRAEIESKRADEDYMRYQLEQFDDARLHDSEQEELEQELQTLSHAEEIRETLYGVYNNFDNEEQSTIGLLSRSNDELQRIAKYYPESQQLAERLGSVVIELKDIADEVQSKLDDCVTDPSRLQQVEERLSLIYELERKHKVGSIAELLSKAENLRTQISLIDDSDKLLSEKERQYALLRKQVMEQAIKLSSARQKAAAALSVDMQHRLVPLGMPEIRFKAEITQLEEPSQTGIDKVVFLFSANKNTPLRNVTDIASGGEIARVMLCLKAAMTGATDCPTIIFDEIDTGVSGRIAEQMAATMHEMSREGQQVISITHLPQIAAFGEHHYRVYKTITSEETNTEIELLKPENRLKEIAYMLSGQNITEAAMRNARELLDDKQTYKEQ